MPRPSRDHLLVLAAGAALALLLFGRLGHPLFWADEAETAMFAEHVLAYGYPKVHGPHNVVYQFGPNIAVGVKEGPDAYIGTTWGHFYYAVPGLLWARATDDLHAKTARARLPFALAGAAGILLWLRALLPALEGGRARRARFAAAFLLASAASISLLLHVREVRHYALVVLLAGAVACLHLGYAVQRRQSFARWALGLPLLLLLLFLTFFQAFFAFGALLALERLRAWRRGEAGPRDLLPLAAAGVLVTPLLVFFETFQTAAAFAEGFGFAARDYAANLGLVALHFLRHEFLAPALACRAAVAWTGSGSPLARRVAADLSWFALGYWLLGCLNPLALERYFVVLSPLVTGVFLLDAFALAASLPERAAPARRPRARALLAAALVLGTLVLRAPGLPAVGGRLAEIATPVQGPLDFAIPYLRERYAHPEELVVATNYEEYAFMYYLGSHTIVGLALNNLVNDRQLEPDVVVPRRRWPRSLAELGPLLARGEWEEVRLPVEDLHHNTVPALSRSRFIPDSHRFRTAASDDPDAQLVLYLRVPDRPGAQRGQGRPAWRQPSARLDAGTGPAVSRSRPGRRSSASRRPTQSHQASSGARYHGVNAKASSNGLHPPWKPLPP
jgi:hypothetical protein